MVKLQRLPAVPGASARYSTLDGRFIVELHRAGKIMDWSVLDTRSRARSGGHRTLGAARGWLDSVAAPVRAGAQVDAQQEHMERFITVAAEYPPEVTKIVGQRMVIYDRVLGECFEAAPDEVQHRIRCLQLIPV